MDRLNAEMNNLRAALAWALAAGVAASALRLATALFASWYSRGDRREGRRWLEAALALPDPGPVTTRVDALFAVAALAAVQDDHSAAAAYAKEGFALARELRYPLGLVRAQDLLGTMAEHQGDLDRAEGLFGQALALARDAREPFWVAMQLTNLADVALSRGDAAEATVLAEESLVLWRKTGNPWGTAWVLGTVAAAALERGDLAQAARWSDEGLSLWLANRDQGGVAGALAGLSGVALENGDPERAVWLLGAASALGAAVGVRRLPHPRRSEHVLTTARATLGETAFAAAWKAGESLPLEQAVAEARLVVAQAIVDAPRRDRPRIPAHPAGLTDREVEVLRLVAIGLSNADVAERLYLSPNTITAHLRRIYRKVGVSSRAAATRFAVDHDLA